MITIRRTLGIFPSFFDDHVTLGCGFPSVLHMNSTRSLRNAVALVGAVTIRAEDSDDDETFDTVGTVEVALASESPAVHV